MKKSNLLLLLIVFFLGSCTVLKEVETVTPDYSVSLKEVELPANSKETFGDIITIESLNDTMRYVFEDEFFKIYWYVGFDRFYFTMFNKSSYPIKIVWDDVAFVNMDQSVSKMIHAGIKYGQRNEAQVATTIPKGAKLEDILIPVVNIELYREWTIIPLFNEHAIGTDAVERASVYQGKTMRILFPVRIQDIENDYTFVFKVDEVKAMPTTITVHDEKAEETRGAILFGICFIGLAGIIAIPFIKHL